MDEDYDFIFVVETTEKNAHFLVSIVEKYNDVGLLADKYPGHVYFYASLTT